MTPTIKLDGRQFTGNMQPLAASQINYILAHLRLAGVIEASTDLPSVKTDDFLTQILARGQKAPILAGCLTEEGKAWTRAEADRNAARFDAITDPGEISEMTSRIAEFVINFCSLRIRSRGSATGNSGISFSPSSKN